MLNTEIFIKRNILYMRFDGELDQKNVDGLRIKVIELIDKYHIKHLVFNFKKLNFMDSSGIGFIIGRYTQLKIRKGKIVVCSMNKMIERIFNLSGLKKICLVTSNEEEAEERLEIA